MRTAQFLAFASTIALCVSGQSDGEEPIDIDFSHYNTLASFFKERSNATVSKTFKGHDLSKDFSADAKAETDWEAVLQIASDVSKEEYSEAAGSHLTLRSDNGILKRIGMWPKETRGVKNDNDWGYCTVLINFPLLNLPIDKPVNGNCTGVFPDACLSWLQDLAKNGTVCHHHADTMDSDIFEGDKFWPRECRDIVKAQSQDPEDSRTLYGANLTNIVKNGGVGRTFTTLMREGGDFDDELPYWFPEDTDYFRAINEVWLMMVGWTKAEEEYTGDANQTIKEEDMAEGSFVCLRAEDFAEGSIVFEDGNLTRAGDSKDSNGSEGSEGDEDSASIRVVANASFGIIAGLAVLIVDAL